MSIPRVPIYIFGILRDHITMIHIHFLWRTHLLAQISFKTGVQYDKIMSQMRALIPHILQFISHPSETKTNVGTSLRQIWLALERSAIKKMGDTER